MIAQFISSTRHNVLKFYIQVTHLTKNDSLKSLTKEVLCSHLIYQIQVPDFAMLNVENTTIALPHPQIFQRLKTTYKQAHEWKILTY